MSKIQLHNSCHLIFFFLFVDNIFVMHACVIFFSHKASTIAVFFKGPIGYQFSNFFRPNSLTTWIIQNNTRLDLKRKQHI